MQKNNCVIVVNVDDPSRTHNFFVEKKGKLPLRAIKEAFGLTRVELADEPGILSFDIYGTSNNVPFKFGETVRVRGVPVERSIKLDHMMEQKLCLEHWYS
jgi:hypothetical protein